MSRSTASEILLRRFKQLGVRVEDAEGVLHRGLTPHLSLPVDTCLRGRPGQVLLLASGWACSQAVLSDGRRQIISLVLPGDVLDIADVRDAKRTLRSLTSIQICDVAPLLERDRANASCQGVREAISALQHQMASYVDNQVVRLGALSAYERVGDLFSELFNRLAVVGLTNGDQFLMPLTQERLGEMLGLSETHVNRTVRQLRQDGLLKVGPGWFALPDRERLANGVGRSEATKLQA